MQNELITLSEAAQMLNCTGQTVLTLITSSLLPRAGTKRRPVTFERRHVESLAAIFRANRRHAERNRRTQTAA